MLNPYVFLGSTEREISRDYHILKEFLNEDIKTGYRDYRREAFLRYFALWEVKLGG